MILVVRATRSHRRSSHGHRGSPETRRLRHRDRRVRRRRRHARVGAARVGCAGARRSSGAISSRGSGRTGRRARSTTRAATGTRTRWIGPDGEAAIPRQLSLRRWLEQALRGDDAALPGDRLRRGRDAGRDLARLARVTTPSWSRTTRRAEELYWVHGDDSDPTGPVALGSLSVSRHSPTRQPIAKISPAARAPGTAPVHAPPGGRLARRGPLRAVPDLRCVPVHPRRQGRRRRLRDAAGARSPRRFG